jgi:predicted glycogen debranching enzyme
MPHHDEIKYRGPLDGPWPKRQIDGDLELAESEWLMTNELGVYAMSTLALMHTRRHHGIFVTEVRPNGPRHVILSHLEMTLDTAGRSHHLSTHQFPNVAPTPGYRTLSSFYQDPLPRWEFKLPSGKVERTLTVVRGHRAVVVALTWTGKEPARLSLRPLLPMRPVHTLSKEHGAMLQKVTLRVGEVEVQPVLELPSVHFKHDGVFMGSPDWWRKFEYLDDRGRYDEFQEDMWSPGLFELTLEPRKTAYLMVYLGEAPKKSPEELVMDTAQYRLSLDPGPAVHPAVRALTVLGNSFVLGEDEGVVAGYPWLDVWSRDLLMSLPGTFLLRGREVEAAKALLRLGDTLIDGFLPQKLNQSREEQTPCIDASLLLFPVVRQLLARAPVEGHLADGLYSLLVKIYRRVHEATKSTAWVNGSGLLENSGARPLTWMDAVAGGEPITARRGLAIELQAYFALASEILSTMAQARGDYELADRALVAYDRARVSFRQRFWCDETNFPFDCLSGQGEPDDSWVDATIRPNAVIALAVCPSLFEPWQRREILSRTDELLLTERGLRTLDYRDSRYVGHAGGLLHERRNASHQGTAWPHLLLYYVRAVLVEHPSERERLVSLVLSALFGGRAIGHVAQMADGDPPHRPRGSPAYAAATAMLLEALAIELQVTSNEVL